MLVLVLELEGAGACAGDVVFVVKPIWGNTPCDLTVHAQYIRDHARAEMW